MTPDQKAKIFRENLAPKPIGPAGPELPGMVRRALPLFLCELARIADALEAIEASGRDDEGRPL